MSEPIEPTLGRIITIEGKDWRIVRIVKEDQALFIQENGSYTAVRQSYIQLMDEEGNVDFQCSEMAAYQNREVSDHLTIKALDPKVWRYPNGG